MESMKMEACHMAEHYRERELLQLMRLLIAGDVQQIFNVFYA